MTVPLSAIFEDHWIDLHSDRYADPDGIDPIFSAPLRVYRVHGGAPTPEDRASAYDVRLLAEPKSVDEEETGLTLLVSPRDGATATLLYFPSDQHEVKLVDPNDEDF